MQTLLATAALLLPAFGESVGPSECIDKLVRSGREALALGRTADARGHFERALELSGNDADLRIWVLRTSIEEGRIEEVLLTAEDIALAGGPDADVDYLMGLASFRTARAAIDAGSPDSSTGNYLLDGQQLLESALEADAERYGDAWSALAEAAWRNGDLEAAERAAGEALSRAPDDAVLHALLGRIAFGRYQQVRETDEIEAEDAWKVARRSFERCIELLGKGDAAQTERSRADAWMQLGHLHAWMQDAEAAKLAYTEAITADPASIDFSQIQGALDAPRFSEVTTEAIQRFGKLHPEGDARIATLHWWDGTSHWRTEDYEHASSAFRSAVELWPAYSASWYWVHRAEFAREQYSESVEALKRFDKVDRPALAALLAQDADGETARLEWLVGFCANPSNHGRAQNADAAFLSGLLTEVQPEESRHWNNLGLFLRDQGESLTYRNEGDPAVSQQLFEQALLAYERALALEPENPNYLNDTAVMLHYYLKRDLERAREMYAEATCWAEAELARPDLPEESRDLVQIALRDSRDNVERLDAWLARVASGEEDLDPQLVR